MRGGLILDMENKNALITNAMLTVYIDEKNMDYTKMLMPFIEATIYDLKYSVGDNLSVNTIKEKTNSEYGLDLKDKVVEKILYKLYKDKNGAILKYTYRNKSKLYTLLKVPDVKKFKQVKSNMTDVVKSVILEFVTYYNNEHIVKKIDYNKGQIIFVDFLNKYNFEIYNDINATNNIMINEHVASDMYYVAKFIIEEHNKKHNHQKNCYNKLLMLQEGYFAQNAIYYFMNGEIEATPSRKISNVYFVLDTRILIDVLGLNYTADADSMAELLELIKRNDGHLCTYEYYMNELKGIIDKYVLDYDSRIYLDLAKFRDSKMSDTQIRVYNLSLKDKLEDKEVTILSPQEYDNMVSSQNWHIDYAALEDDILKSVEYQNRREDIGFINDFETLHAMSYLRTTNKKNIYVFVSSNFDLVKVADRLLNREKLKHTDFGLAISDIDLTTLLWLYNHNDKPNLPSLTLLENAYAAIVPDKRILNKVINVINEKVQSNDKTVKEMALTLRYSEYLLSGISEVVKNDTNNVSPDIVDNLSNHVKNEIRKELAPQIRKKIIDEEYESIHEEQSQKVISEINGKIDSLRKELEEKNKENVYQKQELDKREQQLLKRDSDMSQKVDRVTEERNNYFSEIERLRKIEHDKIDSKAFYISNGFMWIVRIISFMFIMYAILTTGYNCFQSFMSGEKIIDSLINNIGTIITYIPLPSIIFGFSRKVQKIVYDRLQHFLLRKSEVLNQSNKDTQ